MTQRSTGAVDDDRALSRLICGGAEALDLQLTDAQVDQLIAYLRLIHRWNATYNLTAVRDLHAMATQHVVDSLALLPLLRRCLASAASNRVLDVGSGAGLPGVVVAIAIPGADVLCVDSVGKKSAFITQVAATLGLVNLKASHARVESIQPPPSFDVIVSRAFASLPDFVASTRHLLGPGACWIAMKGKMPSDELFAVAGMSADFEPHYVKVPGLNAERCLLLGRDIRESERKH